MMDEWRFVEFSFRGYVMSVNMHGTRREMLLFYRACGAAVRRCAFLAHLKNLSVYRRVKLIQARCCLYELMKDANENRSNPVAEAIGLTFLCQDFIGLVRDELDECSEDLYSGCIVSWKQFEEQSPCLQWTDITSYVERFGGDFEREYELLSVV
jgi:hypothetical protein